jgi:hypothetical protein
MQKKVAAEATGGILVRSREAKWKFRVTDVKEISGNRALSEAAEEAVHKWRFESGDGSATVDVNITFAL